MRWVFVREGNSGILYLTSLSGKTEAFKPNSDLRAAQRELYKTYKMKVGNNSDFSKIAKLNDIDWFPASVGRLYWHFFWPMVQYQSLLDDWQSGKIKFLYISPGKFRNFMQVMAPNCFNLKYRAANITKLVLNFFIRKHNLKMARYQKELIFLRETQDDFRSKELLEQIGERYEISQFSQVSPKLLLKTLFRSQSLIRPYRILSRKPLNKTTGLKASKLYRQDHSKIQSAVIRHLCETVNWHLYVHSQIADIFELAGSCALLGMDDCNYAYPYVYQAQANNMLCIAFQHGAYGPLHETYVMAHLSDHRWFDRIIVWNEYWRKQFLRQNRHIKDAQLSVGNNKILLDYQQIQSKKLLNAILIPYEFLGDTIQIGLYIKEFLSRGFTVYLKTRPDEPREDQLACYHLGEAAGKVILVDHITPELMAEIGVIAGSMSTLLFDLIGYGKPIWILESKFQLRYDMVASDLARLFRFSDLNVLETIYRHDIKSKSNKVPEILISQNSNVLALEKCLLAAGINPIND